MIKLPCGVDLNDLIDDLRNLSWEVSDILLHYANIIKNSEQKKDFLKNKNNDDPTVNTETSPEGTQDENYIGNKSKSLFDWEGAEPFISKIKKIRSREKQRMVFLLENDHVWIQIEPRPQPFREGEQVSIKAGLMGGFNMRSESGAFTRVRRIQ